MKIIDLFNNECYNLFVFNECDDGLGNLIAMYIREIL